MIIKRLTKLNIINNALLFTLVFIVVLQYNLKFIPLSFKDVLVSAIIVTVSLSLIAKSVIYKSDSSLWFALALIGYLVFYLLCLKSVNFSLFWPCLCLIPAAASLVVAIVFKVKLLYHIFLFLTIITFIMFFYSFSIIGLTMFIILIVLTLIAELIAVQNFIRKRKD